MPQEGGFPRPLVFKKIEKVSIPKKGISFKTILAHK